VKAFILEKIANRLKNYKLIKKAFRVDENLILLQFDKDRYYFDLTKGSSDIYINIDYPLSRKFKAPFDIVLERKFTKAKLINVLVKERILTIIVKSANNFKEEIVKLRFEFTGRYTNAIILDEKDIIIESLRHISENQSSRVIKPGIKLIELPSIKIKEKIFEIENLEEYTKENFKKKYEKRLAQKKEAIINKLNKKIQHIQNRLNKLENEKELLEKANSYKKYADIVLANLHKIKPFMKELKTVDFEGNEITIPLPQVKNINEIGNYFYNLSKKAKKKALNLHIEKEHLNNQIEFLKNYKNLIAKTTNLSSLNYYKVSKKEKKEENIEEFFIDNYKVLVGKNEKGNIKLLKTSNANDLWLHIKNYPGSHVIIKNNKLSIPFEVIKEAAKLAVAFSNKEEGSVDYTKRKFVKIKEKANVEYGKYSTIKVKL